MNKDDRQNDYEIIIKIFGKHLISLAVDTETELNGTKPWLFISFMVLTAIIAGIMFLSVAMFIYFESCSANPALNPVAGSVVTSSVIFARSAVYVLTSH